MQISTTTVPICSKKSDILYCRQLCSNTVPNTLCVYYMQLEVLDLWSETRLYDGSVP